MVLYVDLLGFKDLTLESVEVDVRVPPFESGNWQDDYGAGAPGFWTEKSPLSRRLLTFNRRLEELIRRATRTRDLQAMLFSDGGFIVGDHLETVVFLAGEIMRACVLNHVPVRMGLAVGACKSLRFSSEMSGATSIHTALFHGPGVVRAYAAERSGKGLRIFVHPTVVAVLPDYFDGFLATPYEPIRTGFLPLSVPGESASHELDYLNRHNPKRWRTPGFDDSDQQDRKLWEAVQSIRSNAPADREVQVHYEETLAALQRMRKNIGREPF